MAEEPTEPGNSTSAGLIPSEREKWREDLRLREAELDFKRSQIEQDSLLRREELRLKQEENKRARWNNPLTIAIVAAALAGFSNAAVTFVNGLQQNSLQNDKQTDDFQLERSKAETARIFEVIKTGNADVAAKNLDFLLQTGLIQDQEIVKKLANYLKTASPGGGTVLPASGTGFDFATSSALVDMQKQLSGELEKYTQYLRRLNYDVGEKKAQIKIELMLGPNAYVSETGDVVVDIRALGEPDSILHAYTSSILLREKRFPDACGGLCDDLMSAITDYLVTSYLNDPEMGTILAILLNLKENYLRDLRKNVGWDSAAAASRLKIPDVWDAPGFQTRDAWSSLFWAMREQLGPDMGDRIVAQTYSSIAWPADQSVMPAEFVKELLVATRAAAAPEQVQPVEALLRERKFPMPD